MALKMTCSSIQSSHGGLIRFVDCCWNNLGEKVVGYFKSNNHRQVQGYVQTPTCWPTAAHTCVFKPHNRCGSVPGGVAGAGRCVYLNIPAAEQQPRVWDSWILNERAARKRRRTHARVWVCTSHFLSEGVIGQRLFCLLKSQKYSKL